MSGSDADRKIKFAAYWEVLSGLPEEVVITTCRRASHRGIGDRGFLPSSAELYHAAVKELPARRVPMITEPEIPLEERERVSTLIRELAWSMKALPYAQNSVEHKSPNVASDIEAELSAKYHDRPLPKLSDELRAKLGAGIPEIGE